MSFRDDKAAAYADIFEGLGEAAVWHPQSGESVPVRVRFRRQDGGYAPGGLLAVAENPVARLRQAETPTLAAGDLLTIAGTDFRIGTPRVPDPDGLLWETELSRP